MFKFIDSHSHLSFPAYDEDRDEVVTRMISADVGSVDIGTTLQTSRAAVELAQKHGHIWAAVGIHPGHAPLSDGAGELQRYWDKNELREAPEGPEIFNVEIFRKLLNQSRTVAVGECGLDYFHKPYNEQAQKKLFKQHIELALENNKPLIVHCRDAHDDALAILEEYQGKLKGTVHFFTGNIEQAKKYINLGFYIGFDGPITFVNDYDNLIEEIPIDKILIETDCPYATPAPYRGKRNEPSYVIEIAKKIAKLKDISVEEIAQQTTKNTQELFNLK